MYPKWKLDCITSIQFQLLNHNDQKFILPIKNEWNTVKSNVIKKGTLLGAGLKNLV